MMERRHYLIFSILIFMGFISSCAKSSEIDKKVGTDANVASISEKEESIESGNLSGEMQFQFDKGNLEGSFKGFYPKLDILSFFPCNFSDKYNEEYIVFYNDPSQIHNFSAPRDIDKVIVVYLENSKFVKLEDLKLVSIGYDDKFLKIIIDDSKKYGEWNGYCYLFDSDHNGLDELYFYELSGITFGLVIMEYQNDAMKVKEYIEY